MKEEFEGQKDVLIQYFQYLIDKLYEVNYTNEDEIIKEIMKMKEDIDDVSKEDTDKLVEKVDKCLALEEVFNRYPIEEVERYVRRKKLKRLNESRLSK